MMGYITLKLYYDSDGQHNFPLTVWITEMKTQNLLGMNFCQEQVNKIHFDLPGIELKRPINTFCYGSLQLNKCYPYVSQILSVRIPHSMYIEPKTTRCYKFAPENPKNSFPPGSTFLPNRKAVSTGLNFINVLCTRFEKTLPIVMENNKNHTITLVKGTIGYSLLDVLDQEIPKYQVRNPTELAYAILNENEEYNDCFLLHSTIPSQDMNDCIRIEGGNSTTILSRPDSIMIFVPADLKPAKGFSKEILTNIPLLKESCAKQKPLKGDTIPYWDMNLKRFIYVLITKAKSKDKIDPQILVQTLETLKAHAKMNCIKTISMLREASELEDFQWQDVTQIIQDVFAYSEIQLRIYTRNELDVYAMTTRGDPEYALEDEIQQFSEQFHLKHRELETDFTSDAKSCQPPCDEQFKIFRQKEDNERLIEYYLQYQNKEAVQYIKEFDFRYSDLTDEELVLLIDLLMDARDVYSQHKFDVGKTRQKFNIKLEPGAILKRQRPSKVPLHLREKLEKLLTQLKDADIIREMGDDDEMGSLFVNPIILQPKHDYVKLIIDARYLNSVTDLTNYSWPLEPIQTIMTLINGNIFSVSDLSCAFHQVPLDEPTQKLTSFIIGGKQYTFTRGFYGLKGLPSFFSRMMTIHFEPLIKKKQAITYIDDTLMQAKSKQEMFTVIQEYHNLLRKAGLKAAPDKTLFFLRKVKFLGHVIAAEGIQPVAKRVRDLHNLKSPKTKTEVKSFLGALGFYSCYIKNLHVDSRPFYELTKKDTNFCWNQEHEDLFQQIKKRISEDTVLAVPSTKYPFHIHVDSSNVGTGCILIQQFPEGKRIISFNSRVFAKEEQKMSTLHRELCGIVSALQTYEHYIIGSPFPIYLYCDHKPILYLWGRKGQVSPRFFRYQVIISKFPNLKIIWTPGSNLAFPDILSRNVSIEEHKKHQLSHKILPNDIHFFDEHGTQIHYKIKHEENEETSKNDFYPILYEKGDERKILHLQNDGNNFTVNNIYEEPNLPKIESAQSCLDAGRELGKFSELKIRSGTRDSTSDSSQNTYSSINSDADDEACTDNQSHEVNETNYELNTEDLTARNTGIPENAKAIEHLSLPTNSTEKHKTPARELVSQLDKISKEVDLDVTTILQEQINDPVLSVVRRWIQTGNRPTPKSPELQHSKGLMRYSQEFDRLTIEENGNLLCYNEPTDKTEEENLRICLPLSLFLACFRLGHYNDLGGHMGAEKTYLNAKRFYYWPGMHDWICALTQDCVSCQSNKSKQRRNNEVPLEDCETETQVFKTVHIDHKGPLNPPSRGNSHCLLIIDAFSRYLMAYPVRDTGAQSTINAMEKWIMHYGIPQSIIHDRGTAFVNTEFVNWTKELGITLRPRTAHSPWTNGKVETQNQHIARYWRNFLNDSGNNWAQLAAKFAFAHNTSVNYTTGKTPYEIVFCNKPQIPMSLKLGLYRNKNKNCRSQFCNGLPPHCHSENQVKNELLNGLLRPQLSQNLLERETAFKKIYSSTYEKCRKQTARSHAYRNRFKLGSHLNIGQKVLLENHRKDLSKSQKLQQLRLGPFTVTKRITNTTYQIKNDQNPENLRTVHRNHLIEYFPKEETLPPLIEEYTTPYRGDTDFYNNFVKGRIERLNVSEPQILGDLCILPVRNQQRQTTAQKRVRTPQSTDSGIISPENHRLGTPTTPDQPTTSRPPGSTTPIQTLTQQITPEPLTTTPATSTKSLTPLQELRRAVASHVERNPRYQRAQPNQPAPLSILRQKTRVGYKA